MTRWQIAQAWLDDWVSANGFRDFTSRDIARGLRRAQIPQPRAEASRLIQAYLGEQRRPHSRATYAIERQTNTQTQNAVWSIWPVGAKRRAVKQVGGTYFADMRTRFLRAVEPDLSHLADLNPALRTEAEQIIDATLKGAFLVMKAALRA